MKESSILWKDPVEQLKKPNITWHIYSAKQSRMGEKKGKENVFLKFPLRRFTES